jgi:hypothetical protein
MALASGDIAEKWCRQHSQLFLVNYCGLLVGEWLREVMHAACSEKKINQ